MFTITSTEDLKTLLKINKITQKQLAKRLKMTEANVSINMNKPFSELNMGFLIAVFKYLNHKLVIMGIIEK